MDRVEAIATLVYEYEGIDPFDDVASVIHDELASDPDRSDAEVAQAVAQRMVQA